MSPKKITTQNHNVTFTYHPDSLPVRELNLVGSWNDKGAFSLNWEGRATPMKPQPDGSFQATIALTTEVDQEFYWGVKDDDGVWMLFEHEAQSFVPMANGHNRFNLGSRHQLGLHPEGDNGFWARVWAPHARSADLVIQLPTGQVRYSMAYEREYWQTRVAAGWNSYLGCPYGFEFTTECGQKVLRADPYANVRQGPQRGVSDLFVTELGNYTHRYEHNEKGHHLLRFEAICPDEKSLKCAPVLRLYRNGEQLTERALQRLLTKSPKLPEGETWWKSTVQTDGSIPLVDHSGCNAFSICLGPELAARGLEYRIADSQAREYHDPWDSRLDGHHNWPRLGLVSPRERIGKRPNLAERQNEDLVFYELHIGSVLGKAGNLRCSHFGDVTEKLQKIKELGFNCLALMPTNATEGWRDWGYLGTSSLSHQEAYSITNKSAESALLDFVRKAHSLELRVYCDVVYNHVGGFHNDLWNFDGPKNPWFEWNHNPVPLEQKLTWRPYDTVDSRPLTKVPSIKGTPWGIIPAFNKRPVTQFYIDHAMDQIERLGFDGIRFDFTHLIHAPEGGTRDGWELLRAINQRLRYFYPGVLSFAEEFPPHPIITTPAPEGGAGFSGMWNTEHQHRLIFDHHRFSVTQSMVENSKPPLGCLLNHLIRPEGFSDPCGSVTVLSNHDEVGNAQRLYHIVKSHPRGFDIARLVSWFSLLCPGYPILFQGTEDLASNYFSWGLPHTWDGESLLSRGEHEAYRTKHRNSIKDVLQFRKSHQGLWAHNAMRDHFLDLERDLLAICRDKYWIVGNFGPTAQPIPSHVTQKARKVLSSEKAIYGYADTMSRGKQIGSYALQVWEA